MRVTKIEEIPEDLSTLSSHDKKSLVARLPKETREEVMTSSYETHTYQKQVDKVTSYLSQENTKVFTSRLVDKVLKHKGGRAQCMNSPEEAEREIRDFMLLCMDTNTVPLISSLCAWLGIDHETFYGVMRDTQNYDFSCHFRTAFIAIKAINEQVAVAGAVPASVFSLLGKNYFGLKDTTSIEVNTTVDDTPKTINTMKVIQEQIDNEND